MSLTVGINKPFVVVVMWMLFFDAEDMVPDLGEYTVGVPLPRCDAL